MKLNNDNYHSAAANQEYMSTGQLKRFMQCEAMAIAELNGEWEQEDTTALLVGSFVDAYFSGDIDKFRSEHPEIYTRQGTLRAEYRQAEDIIEYIINDDLMMRMLSGKKQAIVTGEIYGVSFRGKIDFLLDAKLCAEIAEEYPQMSESLLLADGAIVDLKIMRDMASVYLPDQGRISFLQAWQYDLQLAIYQALEGHKLPCFIVCATKEKQADKAVIHIPQYMLDVAIETAKPAIERAAYVKANPTEAVRCERCDYCRQTKILTGAISADELEGALI